MGTLLVDKRKGSYMLGQFSKVCPDAGEPQADGKAGCDRGGSSSRAMQGLDDTGQAVSRWSDLPEPLLESIFLWLGDDAPSGQKPRPLYLASGTCRSWRAAGRAAFFGDPWRRWGNSMLHPQQLITLRPAPAAPCGGSQLIKCFVRRQVASSGLSGRLHRFSMFQGADHSSPSGGGERFLMAAVQETKQRYALHLSRGEEEHPMATLATNVMRTAYSLVPEPGGWLEAGWQQQHHHHHQHLERPQQWEQQQEQQQQQQQQQWEQQEQWDCERGRRSSCGSGGQCGDQAPGCAASLRRRTSAGVCTPGPAAGRAGGPQSHSQAAPGPAPGEAALALARVRYKVRVRGMMLPRRMSVEVPRPPHLREADAGADGADEADGHGRHHQHQHHHHQQQQQQQQELGVPLSPRASLDVPMPAVPPPLPTGSGVRRLESHEEGAYDVHDDGGDDDDDNDGDDDGDDGDDDDDGDDVVRGRTDQTSERRPPKLLQGGCPQQQQRDQQQQGGEDHRQKQLDNQQQQQQQLGRKAPPPLLLINKPPHWNDALRCWCLNFRGRVKLASVKNFQLVAAPHQHQQQRSNSSRHREGGPQAPPPAPPVRGAGCGPGCGGGWGCAAVVQGGVVMQFGKVDKDTYILDYNPGMLTALQAFSVALTTFGGKVLL